MVNAIIDGHPISVEEGTTILKAANDIGIGIPHLCFLKDINEIAACRSQRRIIESGPSIM